MRPEWMAASVSGGHNHHYHDHRCCHRYYHRKYDVFDTCNSPKKRFRQMVKGTMIQRKTFRQLPWQTAEYPTFIRCRNGVTLLTSGWCTSFPSPSPHPQVPSHLIFVRYFWGNADGLARKVHYTADFTQMMTWALICSFGSPFPWFLHCLFMIMILHRAWRNTLLRAKKYGND